MGDKSPKAAQKHASQKQGKATSSSGVVPARNGIAKIKWLGATNGPTICFGLYETATHQTV